MGKRKTVEMRLLTHSDFDGIVCAVLITTMEEVDFIKFLDPKALQDRKINVTENDIISDLPFHPKCGLYFDHHLTNKPDKKDFEGSWKPAKSAARVVYEYYENPYLDKYLPLIEAADKIDSGEITLEEVKNPDKYGLLATTLDSEAEKMEDDEFRRKVICWLKEHTVEKILSFPEVRERVEKNRDADADFEREVGHFSRVEGKLVITDLRGYNDMPRGNRYLIYALYPQCNISVKIFDHTTKPDLVKVSAGYNVFNKTATANIGEIMKKFKGGGHKEVGGCTFPKAGADEKIKEILRLLKH